MIVYGLIWFCIGSYVLYDFVWLSILFEFDFQFGDLMFEMCVLFLCLCVGVFCLFCYVVLFLRLPHFRFVSERASVSSCFL